MNAMAAEARALKLSICITTFNRAAFIGATLDTILAQMNNECEIVVLDGGSTDDTERIVAECSRRFHGVRYFKQNTNNGFDRDCNQAVELANGEYCWLMTDDDLLKPGAVAAVLVELVTDVSLVIVNSEIRSFDMLEVLQSRWLSYSSDRMYERDELDRLFVEMRTLLLYVGCFIIRRSIWVARKKERYYGTQFSYLGVVFQEPLPGRTILIAKPFISYRLGNVHTFSPRMFETFMVDFPSLVWSLPLSDWAKKEISSAEPWRKFHELLWRRGCGFYSLVEYRRTIRPRLRLMKEALVPVFVALLPGALVNAILVLYYSTARRRRGVWEAELSLGLLRESRFYIRNIAKLKLAPRKPI